MHKLQPIFRKICTPVFILQCCDKLIQPVETTYRFLFTRVCLRRTNYIDLDTALSNQTILEAHRGSIIHLLMIAKYTLYRSRFIIQTLPSTRFLILNMVLTLAKTLKLEQEQQMLHHILQRMK